MKKELSINHLQLRLFLLIFVIFIITKIGYRVFIERPNMEHALSIIIEQDIADISLAAQNQLSILAMLNYDYSTSNASYRFIQTPTPSYTEEHLIDQTFKNLAIEGAFFIDENFQIVYEKTLNLITGQAIDFEFLNIKLQPNNKNMLSSDGQVKGIVDTLSGPAFFSAMQIRRSDGSGENEGYLVFVRLIKDKFLKQVALDTRTQIIMTALDENTSYDHLADWTDTKAFDQLTPTNERIVRDFNNTPIALITVVHSSTIMEPWFGLRGLIFLLVFFVLLLIIHRYFVKVFVQPVEHLFIQLKNMTKEEQLDRLNENSQVFELNSFAKKFNLLSDIIQQQKSTLSQQAFLDPLTKIANRRAFELHIKEQIELLNRHGIGFCLIMADIDHFKRYNDSSGHQQGDKALIEVANLLNGFFKRNNDICARYGGEEFIMLFSDVGEAFVAKKAGEIIAELQQKAIQHPDSPTSSLLTLSLGVSIVTFESNNIEKYKASDIIEQADQALYQAKNTGRNKYCCQHFQ